jgi:hypothetical protein
VRELLVIHMETPTWIWMVFATPGWQERNVEHAQRQKRSEAQAWGS